MKTKSKYSLQRTMVVYFLLIGVAALFVGVEFIAETHGNEMRQAFLARAADHAQPMAQNEILQPLNHLRDKAILVIAIILVVILIVMTMFMKHITEPLQHMITAARQISAGDLSQTIRIDGNNELAELGGVINEMASNLQEIIHMSRNTCASGEALLADMAAAINHQDSLGDNRLGVYHKMDQFRAELGMLEEALDCFKFYAIPEADA